MLWSETKDWPACAASAEESILTGSLLFKTVLAVLACYRLARLVAYDEAFDWLRKSVKPESVLGKLFSCPYCVGFWFAILMVVLVELNTSWSLIILLALGIAGAQDYLESSMGEDR